MANHGLKLGSLSLLRFPRRQPEVQEATNIAWSLWRRDAGLKGC